MTPTYSLTRGRPANQYLNCGWRPIILESFPYGFACPKMEKSTLVRSPVTISNERLGVITAYMAALALTARSWAEAFSARSRDIAAITADNKGFRILAFHNRRF